MKRIKGALALFLVVLGLVITDMAPNVARAQSCDAQISDNIQWPANTPSECQRWVRFYLTPNAPTRVVGCAESVLDQYTPPSPPPDPFSTFGPATISGEATQYFNERYYIPDPGSESWDPFDAHNTDPLGFSIDASGRVRLKLSWGSVIISQPTFYN